MKLKKSHILVKTSNVSIINIILLKIAQTYSVELQMDHVLIQIGGLITLMALITAWAVYLLKIDVETKI